MSRKSRRKKKTFIPSTIPGWKRTEREAKTGSTLDEGKRARVAKLAALNRVLSEFAEELGRNMSIYKTNLGELLGSDDTLTGTLVIHESGEDGTDEYVELEVAVKVGEIQERNDYLKTTKNKHAYDLITAAEQIAAQ